MAVRINRMKQCFIISLPRSGSTLLQRLLAAHPCIQTIGEPWIALSFVYALKEKVVRGEYGHRSLVRGVSEFVQALPGGSASYYLEAGRMMDRLHAKMATDGRVWFLDKTPRYYLILNELMAMFPEARFIVLQRNPLAVVASILNTWHDGRFRARANELDIYEGPQRIAQFVKAGAGNYREVRFEDLVNDPTRQLRAITDFLDLEPLNSVALEKDDPLKRSVLGDKSGIHRYSQVSAAPVDAWKESFASPIRKLWARRYLEWLGDDAIKVLGYDRKALLAEIESIPLAARQTALDLLDCHVRLLPLYVAPRLDFVKRLRRDLSVRYRWKPKF
jgi:hypothetical protein